MGIISFLKNRKLKKSEKKYEEFCPRSQYGDRMARARKAAEAYSSFKGRSCILTFFDWQFYNDLPELSLVGYYSRNGLSGGASFGFADFSARPEHKERVIELLGKYRLETLTFDDLNMNARDVDHWSLLFKFDKTGRVYELKGYGRTEKTSPILSELLMLLRYDRI